MITENDVINAVCAKLEGEGFTIMQKRSTFERGIDVVAQRGSTETVLVEAKGGTSSKVVSARFGQPFTSAQVFSHIAKALFSAAKLFRNDDNPTRKIIVALPDTPLHRRHVEQAAYAFAKLKIGVWVVGTDGAVDPII